MEVFFYYLRLDLAGSVWNSIEKMFFSKFSILYLFNWFVIIVDIYFYCWLIFSLLINTCAVVWCREDIWRISPTLCLWCQSLASILIGVNYYSIMKFLMLWLIFWYYLAQGFLLSFGLLYLMVITTKKYRV